MRRRAIAIDGRLLRDILTDGEHPQGFRIEEGLPEGARFVRSYHDGPWGCEVLIFEHDSFDDVEEGGETPVVKPKIWLLDPHLPKALGTVTK